MKPIVGTRDFTDGSDRDVYLDDDGQQFVVGDADEVGQSGAKRGVATSLSPEARTMFPIARRSLVLFCWMFALAPATGQDLGQNSKLQKILANLQGGMTGEEVKKLLGPPDEIRHLPENGSLDGTRIVGGRTRAIGIGPETERWAYGIMGKGMFAKIGYVAIDKNGKVVAGVAPDSFALSLGTVPERMPEFVPSMRGEAVETAAKLKCELGPVKAVLAADQTVAWFTAKATVKNAGTTAFKLKHDAANAPLRFFVTEIYDAKGTLLFREDQLKYQSLIYTDANRPVLTIPAKEELVVTVPAMVYTGFGRLRPGEYRMRVYFPFEERKYYPSNIVTFEAR